MRFLTVVIFLIFSTLGYSQCEYSQIKFDKSTRLLFLKQYPVTLDIFETPFNGRIILASMMRIGDNFTIDLEITTDSNAQELEPVCFKKGSKLTFSLTNNETVTLEQREEIICGIKQDVKDTDYNTVSNYARFVIDLEMINKLKEHEIVLMKVESEDYNKTFVLKSELEEVKNDEIVTSNPTRYFIDNLECLTHPKI